MADVVTFNGNVEWSGENPGISLKDNPDGPWTNLASFFRVVLSPYGRGHALVLLQSPGEANPPAGKPIPRDIAGHTITTAMLAFSETWIRA